VSNKGEPFYLDAMWYGRPNYRVTGDGSTVADWDAFITDSSVTNVNGLIQNIGGAYHLRCGIQLGNAAQTATTTFLDATGKQMIFKRTLYHTGSAYADSLNYGDYYIVQGLGAASFRTSITFGSVVGTGSSRQGVLGGGFRSEDVTNVTWRMDFQTDKTDLSAVKLYGLDVIGAKGGVLLDNDSGSTEASVVSCAFINCGEIDPGTTGDGVEMLNFAVIDPLGGTAANRGLLLRQSGSKYITNGSFITSGVPTTQHMIHASDTPESSPTFDALKFFGDYSSATLWHGEVSGNGTIASSYSESNQDSTLPLYSGSNTQAGQTVDGNGGKVSYARFYLRKLGSPTGNVRAYMYAASGGVPTGGILATSQNVDISTLSTSYALIRFRFQTSQRITMASGTNNYAVVVEYTGGDVSNRLEVGYDASSPGHSGSAATYSGSWTGQSYDLCFYLYTGSTITLDATNGANPNEEEFESTGSPLGIANVNNAVTHRVSGLTTGSRVVWIRQSDEAELENQVESSGQADYVYNYGGSPVDVWVQILSLDEKNKLVPVTLGASFQNLPASQEDDPFYFNP